MIIANVLLVVLIAACCESVQCLSQCFTDTHTACNVSLHKDSLHQDPVRVSVWPRAGPEFLRAVAALTCYHEGVNATYCWLENTTTGLDCNGLPCSVVNLSLVRDEQLVSAMLLGNTLQRKDSQLALMLKGFQVHDVVFNVVYNVSDVPVASWVCLSVGTLLSGLLLSKLLCPTNKQ